ncbi:MAG: toll/interleukin-1 receptor domain-containing protein [Promethearchaeota archaeon]
MEFNVFISYATEDSEYFEIPYIASKLKSYQFIEDVIYWEKNMNDDIVKYMNDNIERCEIFLIFCSKNASKSEAVNIEWRAAFKTNKKIIPIFERVEDIPTLLSSKLGVFFSKRKIDDVIEQIYKLIIKKVSPKNGERSLREELEELKNKLLNHVPSHIPLPKKKNEEQDVYTSSLLSENEKKASRSDEDILQSTILEFNLFKNDDYSFKEALIEKSIIPIYNMDKFIYECYVTLKNAKSSIVIIFPTIIPEILQFIPETAYKDKNVEFVLIGNWSNRYFSIVMKMKELGNILVRELQIPVKYFILMEDNKEFILISEYIDEDNILGLKCIKKSIPLLEKIDDIIENSTFVE